MSASATTARQLTIWTIGHSTRPLPEFLDVVAGPHVESIVDVRRFPGSHRCPQYGKEALETALAGHAIQYHWLPALGGRRRTSPDSPNTAWRNTSFRGHADYMASREFTLGLAELVEVACAARTAIMCSEALWWRCHRSMIADALSVRGIEVVHLLDAKHSAVHPMTAPARIVGGVLTYATADRISH